MRALASILLVLAFSLPAGANWPMPTTTTTTIPPCHLQCPAPVCPVPVVNVPQPHCPTPVCPTPTCPVPLCPPDTNNLTCPTPVCPVPVVNSSCSPVSCPTPVCDCGDSATGAFVCKGATIEEIKELLNWVKLKGPCRATKKGVKCRHRFFQAYVS